MCPEFRRWYKKMALPHPRQASWLCHPPNRNTPSKQVCNSSMQKWRAISKSYTSLGRRGYCLTFAVDYVNLSKSHARKLCPRQKLRQAMILSEHGVRYTEGGFTEKSREPGIEYKNPLDHLPLEQHLQHHQPADTNTTASRKQPSEQAHPSRHTSTTQQIPTECRRVHLLHRHSRRLPRDHRHRQRSPKSAPGHSSGCGLLGRDPCGHTHTEGGSSVLGQGRQGDRNH